MQATRCFEIQVKRASTSYYLNYNIPFFIGRGTFQQLLQTWIRIRTPIIYPESPKPTWVMVNLKASIRSWQDSNCICPWHMAMLESRRAAAAEIVLHGTAETRAARPVAVDSIINRLGAGVLACMLAHVSFPPRKKERGAQLTLAEIIRRRKAAAESTVLSCYIVEPCLV